MINLSNRKGFTLIELLVVISIIGLLSTIVLAALSTARLKAQDAKVKNQLSSMRTQANLYTGTGNDYNTGGAVANCYPTPGGTIANTIFESGFNGLGNLLTTLPLVGSANVKCSSYGAFPTVGGSWAVAAPLPSSAGVNYWCVDSAGAARGALDNGTLYTAAGSASAIPTGGAGTVCRTT